MTETSNLTEILYKCLIQYEEGRSPPQIKGKGTLTRPESHRKDYLSDTVFTVTQ